MLISAFARTQIAALFGTAILTVLPATMFAGMLVPVSSLTGHGAHHGPPVPDDLFLPISVGTFTKGLGFADLGAESGRARAVRPGADAAEPAAAAQAGALGRAPMRDPRQHLLARHQGTAQLSARLTCCWDWSSTAFSLAVIAQAQSSSQEVHNASIAIVDEDHSVLSRRIAHAFLPPYFQTAAADRRARHRAVDECRTIHLRDRHPAEFRARRSRRAAAGDPAQRRCDGDGAGRARGRLCPADHRRPRSTISCRTRGGEPRCRRSISSCASPSTPTSRPRGSPA